MAGMAGAKPSSTMGPHNLGAVCPNRAPLPRKQSLRAAAKQRLARLRRSRCRPANVICSLPRRPARMIAPTSTLQRTLHAARNRHRLSIWSPMTTTLDCAFFKAEHDPTGLSVDRPFGLGVPFHAVERRANDPFRGDCFVEQRIPDSRSEVSTPVRVRTSSGRRGTRDS